jgi:hypothetical protein
MIALVPTLSAFSSTMAAPDMLLRCIAGVIASSRPRSEQVIEMGMCMCQIRTQTVPRDIRRDVAKAAAAAKMR